MTAGYKPVLRDGVRVRRTICALAAVLAVWHGYFFTIGYRITADDVHYLEKVLTGYRGIAEFTSSTAIGQGRIGAYLLMPLNMAASWLSSFELARAIAVALYILVAGLFAVYVGRLLSIPIAPTVFLAWLALHPLAFEHMPPTAYPLQNTIPFLLVVGCRLHRLAALNSPSYSPLSHRIIIYMLLLIAMLATEYAALLAIALIGGEWLVRISRHADEKPLLQALRRFAQEKETSWEAGSVSLMLIIYFSFRSLHPSEYDGNSLDGLWNFYRLAKTTAGHVHAGTILPRINSAIFTDVPIAIWSASVVTGSMMMIAFSASLRLAAPRRTYFLPVLAYIMLAVLLVTLPVTGNNKFQVWCVKYGSCGFLDSRTSYLGIALILGFGAVELTSRIPAGRFRRFMASAFGVAAGVSFMITSLHNWQVSREMAKIAEVWQLADRIHCFAEVVENWKIERLINADGRVSFHPGVDREKFWRLYFPNARWWSNCPTEGDARDEALSEIKSLRPTLPAAVPLAFAAGANARFLGDGWSHAEDWGVWSDGSVATLVFLSEGIEQGPSASLVLEFNVYFDSTLTRQNLEFRADDQVLWRREVSITEATECCQAVVPLPDELLENRTIQLDLHIADPKASDSGSDPRRLGIGLRKIWLAVD